MPLFKTTDEITKYIPINENTRFDTLKPAIIEAEELFIKDLLGAFYPVLLADYTDKTDAEGETLDGEAGMSAANLAILPYVQRTLAHYAAYLSVESVGVTFGDAGIQQTFSQNSQPAPRWKVRDLQVSFITKADRFADKLLEFLEENATALVYAEWFADDTANTKLSGLIVYSTKIASRYIDINESRRVFLRLKKRIKEIETRHIKTIICTDQYDALIGELASGLSEENEALISLIEPIIAKKALYESLPSLRISVSPEGIHLISVSDSAVLQQSAGKQEIEDLRKSLRDGDLGYISDEEKLKAYITEHIADYPLIEASACYSATPVSSRYVADNDKCNKHFSV